MSAYRQRLANPKWQKLRLEIMQAADFKCEDCGCRDTELQVHHCAYISGKMPWEYDSSLLMCVCDRCHVARQSKEDAIRVSIGKITRFLSPDRLESEAWEIVNEMSHRETSRLASSFS
jgi:5-methylcytosine-specific restriction endonuclease McrA